MKRTQRVVAAVTFGLTLATTTLTTSAASADDHDDDTPVPDLAWGDCPEDFPPAPQYTCTTVDVPLDHADPDGATTELAMVRRRADSPSQRQGTIFVNPGGPGGPGTLFVAFVGEDLFDEEVEKRFDIVGFDPRGIASSSPLRCFDNTWQENRAFGPYPWPESDEEFEDQRQRNLAFNYFCRTNGGPIIDHMHTTNVARDMELLRKAVGDEQLNFVGYSYGSYVGNMYANLFPDKVGAVIIDGVIDPVDWATGTPGRGREPVSARLDSDVGAQDTLDEFFRLCDDAGPDACAFAPDSATRFADLYAAMEDGVELTDPQTGETFVVDERALVGETLGYLYSSFAFPDLGGFLAAVEAAVAGATPAPALVDALRATRELPPPYFGLEGSLGVNCTDGRQPRDLDAWKQVAQNEVNVFTALWGTIDVQCQRWPTRGEGVYYGPFTADTANPVLIASTVYDPATAYDGATAAREQLPNSALLTVNGWGHTTPGLSTCADAISNAYLISRDVPARDMVCDQDVNPFDLVGAAPAGGAARPEAALAEAARAAGDDDLAEQLERRARLMEHITGTFER